MKKTLYLLLCILISASLVTGCSRGSSQIDSKNFFVECGNDTYFINGNALLRQNGNQLDAIFQTDGANLISVGNSLYYLTTTMALAQYDLKSNTFTQLTDEYTMRKLKTDGTYLYYITEQGRAFYKLDPAAPSQPIELFADEISCFAVHAQKVYYVRSDTSELYCFDEKSGKTTLLLSDVCGKELKYYENALYFVNSASEIAKMDLSTQSVSVLTEPVEATRLDVCKGKIYYTTAKEGKHGEIIRIDHDGTDPEICYTEPFIMFAATEDALFVLTDDLAEDGFVKIDKDGTQTVLSVTH